MMIRSSLSPFREADRTARSAVCVCVCVSERERDRENVSFYGSMSEKVLVVCVHMCE